MQAADAVPNGAHVSHRLYDVPGAGLTFGADHGRSFTDAAERLAKVRAAADERHLKRVLIDVVMFIGRCEHFGLVDIIDAKGLQQLSFDEVADAALGHDRDGYLLGDTHDHLRVGHAGDPAISSNVRWDTFERHDGAGAGLFRDLRLLRRNDVHDDAALQHLGQAGLDLPSSCFACWGGAVSVLRCHIKLHSPAVSSDMGRRLNPFYLDLRVPTRSWQEASCSCETGVPIIRRPACRSIWLVRKVGGFCPLANRQRTSAL